MLLWTSRRTTWISMCVSAWLEDEFFLDMADPVRHLLFISHYEGKLRFPTRNWPVPVSLWVDRGVVRRHLVVIIGFRRVSKDLVMRPDFVGYVKKDIAQLAPYQVEPPRSSTWYKLFGGWSMWGDFYYIQQRR